MTRFTWRGHTSAPSPDNTNTVSLVLCFALLLPLLLASGCSSGTSSASTSTAPSSPVKTVTPVSITTSSLPSGTVGTPYSQTIAAANGTTPYTFGVATGTLPAGLTLSTSGVISGTPTAAGSSTFGIQVTDSSSPAGSATTSFSITVNPPPVAITTTALSASTVGSAYTQPVAASGGTTPYTFSLSSGSLPTGLTLSSAGIISGTPTAAGASTFTLKVTDSSSPALSATASFSITVNSSPMAITTATLSTPTLGSAYSQAIAASGGTAPYAFSLQSGSLPVGLTLAANGTISGTPTVAGASTFTIAVNDSSPTQLTANATYTVTAVNTVVQVNAASTLAVVPQTGFGIHTSVYDSSLSDTTNLPGLLQTGGVTVMRYPGGIYSDVYHWAQNTLTPFFASVPPACGSTQNGYLAPNTDFGHFIKTLQAVGAQAIITINYGTSVANSTAAKTIGSYNQNTCSNPNTAGQPQEAAAWVAYSNGSPSNTQVIGIDAAGFDWKTVGYWASLRAATPIATDDGYNFLRIGQSAALGIKYWELGNEIFYNGYNANQNTETDLHAPYVYPSGYGTTSIYNSRAMVPALSPSSYGTNAIPFIQAMKAVDSTIKIGFVMSSPQVDPIPATWNPAALQAVCAGANFDFAILHYYPGSYNNVTAAQLFSLPQKNMPALVTTLKTQLSRSCPSNASAIQFFVTETGPNGTLASGTPALIPGLYAAHEYLVSLENGIQNIDWLELHNNYLTTGTEAPNPAYYGIEMAHLLAGVGDSLVTTTSSNTTILAHASLKTAGGKGVLLINTDPSNPNLVQITISGATVGATATQYSYGLSSTQTTAALPSSTLSIPGSTFTVSVPPYTATEVILQ
ncbi:putative Ig domain-containing protein [Edaphobacter aggregans]|uniref:Putative Ig domain-containing protein n=1 Tax=Edaphobacter aggregans TaxID=570835 RepID=A0A428MRP9_9BACT|nr:putative Ig domain-containing protein [Edaphobacter aggregans]